MNNSPSIDPGTLEELRSLQGPEDPSFVASLMTLFLDTLRSGMEKLEAAAGRADVGEIRHEAHALKSSCLNIGALKMGAACQAIETAAQEGSPTEIARLVAELRQQAAAVSAEVKALPELSGRP